MDLLRHEAQCYPTPGEKERLDKKAGHFSFQKEGEIRKLKTG